jgi:hypothetical protein
MQFIRICERLGIKDCVKEYRFHPQRRFRLDYYFSVGLGVELEGGVFVNGAHVRPYGFLKDMEKYNLLTEQGIFLLRYAPNHIDYEQIKRVHLMLSNKSVNK